MGDGDWLFGVEWMDCWLDLVGGGYWYVVVWCLLWLLVDGLCFGGWGGVLFWWVGKW